MHEELFILRPNDSKWTFDPQDLPKTFILHDHHGGYDKNFKNNFLYEKLNNQQHTIITHQIYDKRVHENYPNLCIKFSAELQSQMNFCWFTNYTIHPTRDYNNFVCSFNGANHVGRQLLVSALNKFGYFKNDYCSKNFTNTGDEVDGHIQAYVKNTEFYNKFFDLTDKFSQHIYSFGNVSYEYLDNIRTFEKQLAQSFLHIVSETMADSYHPFVTEKFLYSVITKGLFLAYAQPDWHAHLEKYYGFRLYTNLFDYRFDSITNPVERLVELMTMIGKFSKLTTDEWHDLYLLEQENVEFNYNHYFSKNYLKSLKQFDNTDNI